MATVSSGESLPWQLFFSPTILSANAVYLSAFSILLLVAVFRLRTAPALGWLILYIMMQIVVFALRVYEIDRDSVSRDLHRTIEGFTVISFLVLLQTLVILVSEHFATVDHFRVGMRRHSLFNHFLSALLIGAGIAAIYYAVNLGEKRLDGTDRAYIILLFIFLGLLLLHLLLRGPYLRYETTIFLFFLTLLCLVPVIYLELYHDRVTNWISTSETASYVLWTLPQALVTLGLVIVPLYTWYPEYRSAWIY